MTASKRKHREGTVWQRRFWDHVVRDDRDYENHVNYIHYNPVKHGLVERALNWPFSTFHRHVDAGLSARGWRDVLDGIEDLRVGE
jgi:putative transposase